MRATTIPLRVPTATAAFLGESAFWGLIFSAAEVYKRECFGMLLGTYSPYNNVMHITCSIPFQAADRGYSWVAQNVAAHKRVQSILKGVPHLDFMGHFHSHGDGPLALSKADRKLVQEDGFMLLIDIRKTQRQMTWRSCSDGSVYGTVGEFYYRMVGYIARQGKERKLQLICPIFQPGVSRRRRVRSA